MPTYITGTSPPHSEGMLNILFSLYTNSQHPRNGRFGKDKVRFLQNFWAKFARSKMANWRPKITGPHLLGSHWIFVMLHCFTVSPNRNRDRFFWLLAKWCHYLPMINIDHQPYHASLYHVQLALFWSKPFLVLLDKIAKTVSKANSSKLNTTIAFALLSFFLSKMFLCGIKGYSFLVIEFPHSLQFLIFGIGIVSYQFL